MKGGSSIKAFLIFCIISNTRHSSIPESQGSSLQQALRLIRVDITVLFCSRNSRDKLLEKDVHLFERSHKLV